MKLKNKTIIITGASSGIGKATAKKLAAEGANLVLAARRIEKLDELVKDFNKYGGQYLALKVDVSKKEEVDILINKAIEIFLRIDILINNAGIMPLSFFDKVKVDEWDKMIDVNIKGLLYGIAGVIPHFIENKRGHIINISSVAGRRVFPGGGVYSATKFAVNAITEGLRQELSAKHNIKVTSIEPGATKTELGNSITDEDIVKAWESRMGNVTFLESEDIAESIFYVCTQEKRVNVTEVLVHPTEGP